MRFKSMLVAIFMTITGLGLAAPAQAADVTYLIPPGIATVVVTEPTVEQPSAHVVITTAVTTHIIGYNTKLSDGTTDSVHVYPQLDSGYPAGTYEFDLPPLAVGESATHSVYVAFLCDCAPSDTEWFTLSLPSAAPGAIADISTANCTAVIATTGGSGPAVATLSTRGGGPRAPQVVTTTVSTDRVTVGFSPATGNKTTTALTGHLVFADGSTVSIPRGTTISCAA